jgi:hypothetical protein
MYALYSLTNETKYVTQQINLLIINYINHKAICNLLDLVL